MVFLKEYYNCDYFLPNKNDYYFHISTGGIAWIIKGIIGKSIRNG